MSPVRWFHGGGGMGAVSLAALVLSAQAALGAGVLNGTFENGVVAPPTTSGPLDLGLDNVPVNWTRVETFTGTVLQPGGGLAPVPELSVITVVQDNGPSAPGAAALQCSRSENAQVGGTQSGDWTAVWQDLSINAADYQSLSLQIDTKVLAHNLQAGGWSVPAFEWPVVLELTYTPQGGGSQLWRYGWYLDPPGDGAPSPVNDPGIGLIPGFNDVLVPQGQWVTTTFNLFKELPQLGTITRIRVGGSGWDFEGRADNIIISGVPADIPEPATVALLSLAACGLGGYVRRRRAA